MDREAWRAAVHGVAKSWPRLSDRTELNWTELTIFRYEEEFKITRVKMVKYLKNRMEKMQESIHKDLEELKNKHTETNNTISEIKNKRNQ